MTEQAPEGGNIADTNKLVRECAKAMDEIDEARKDLNEQAGDIRERLRDAGLNVKAFNDIRELMALEEEVRNSYLDARRVYMEALGDGEQGNMFDQAEAADNVVRGPGSEQTPA